LSDALRLQAALRIKSDDNSDDSDLAKVIEILDESCFFAKFDRGLGVKARAIELGIIGPSNMADNGEAITDEKRLGACLVAKGYITKDRMETELDEYNRHFLDNYYIYS
jgi:hypothetical protein